MKKREKIVIERLHYNPVDHIPKKWLSVRNKILWKIKHKKEYDGAVRCPICGNAVVYSMETFNYSFHVMCKTKGCINFFEHGTEFMGR